MEKIYYLSPIGLDSDPGTPEEPMRTLEAAVKRARETGARHIVLHGGLYPDTHVTFSPEDAGLVIESYPSETPVLTGARSVSDWTREDEFLTARIPFAGEFRVLEVNGGYRPRARYPERGALEHLSRYDVRWMSSAAGGWEVEPTLERRKTMVCKPGDLPDDFRCEDAQVTVYHEWDESLVRAEKYDPKTGEMTFAEPCTHPAGAFSDRNRNATTYVVWNTREGMTKPGQWRVEGDKLIYWPMEGETAWNTRALVPCGEGILRFEKGARDIVLDGIALAGDAQRFVPAGCSARSMGACVSGEGVENVRLARVEIRDVTGWAVDLSGSGIEIAHCDMHHLGAGGVQMRGTDNTVLACKIHDVGLVHEGAVGYLGGGARNTVAHCEFSNIPYCGICGVGDNSTVEANLFWRVKQFMQDGGAIYVFGEKGVVMRRNAVLYPPENEKPIRSYYVDEKCENCVIEGNLSVNAAIAAHGHMTRDCAFRNNVFLSKCPQKVTLHNCFGVRFDRNVMEAPTIEFVAPTGPHPDAKLDYEPHPVMKPYSLADGVVSFGGNAFRAKRVILSEVLQYHELSRGDWENARASLYGEPLVYFDASGNVRFPDASPCPSLGIEPLGLEGVGCSGALPELLSSLCEIAL